MIQKIFSSLGLGDIEAKVYFALLEFGPQPAGALSKKLGIPRSSLYGVLRRLLDTEIVGETVRHKVSIFAAEPPDRLKLLFRRRREELDHHEGALDAMLPLLKKRRGGRLLRPKVQVFEGGDGLRAALKDMLLYSNADTFSLWPIGNMLEVLGGDFFRYLNKERIRNHIRTQALWPVAQAVDIRKHPYLGTGKEFLREIRLLPPHIHFPMGYWVYAEKAAFISSRAESFGFVIESQELAETLRAQFDVLWAMATPFKPDAAASRAFLAEVRSYRG